MKINFILNGEDVRMEADMNDSLSLVLSGDKGLSGFCGKASCLRCLVSLDGRPVLSCQVPMFRVRGREVVTLEAMRFTQDWVRLKAFMDFESFPTCSQCTEIQMFHILSALETGPLREEDLGRLISEVPCRCATQEALEKIAGEFLRTREGLNAKRR